MAPSSPTCVSCDRPFPGNGELASLPEGRRIAFDPGQRRVWRICTKCGEWNLLGAEAAGAALGELEARVPTRGSALLITHVGPRLELLRVDNFADVRVGELAMAERRDTLSSGSGLIGAIMGVGIVAVILICIWFASRRAELVVYLTIMFSIGMFGREWYRRRQGLRLSRNRLELGTIFAVAGLISAIVGGVDLLVIGWAALTGVATFATTIVLPITTKLPSGRAVRAPAEHWESIGIRWDVERGEISLQPRDGSWLGPSDSRAFLRHIMEESLIAALTDEALAKGHLLATTHSIEGILGALDAWRQDRDDTLRLTDIPLMYLIALELGFERREGGSPKAQFAHEKLLEAARVAEEAELLDKGSA